MACEYLFIWLPLAMMRKLRMTDSLEVLLKNTGRLMFELN